MMLLCRHIPKDRNRRRAKLNESNVITIRLMNAACMSKNELAKKYDVHYITIDRITKGRTWKHLELVELKQE